MHGGDDKVHGNAGDDRVEGKSGDDRVYGGKGNDIVDGGTGDDFVAGNSGDDLVRGGTGNDKVIGGTGSDTLEGGAGNNHLWGGSFFGDNEGDLFIIAPGGGKDMVHDFEIAHDQLDLSAYGVEFAGLSAVMQDQGWATIIDLSGFEGGLGRGQADPEICLSG